MVITQMTITELKATAYDILVRIEELQRNLAQVNQQITKELAKPKKENKPNDENNGK